MTPEHKRLAVELIEGWSGVFWRDAGNRMAALLQELIDAPEQAGVPVCRVSGYFGGYLTVETIDKAAVLPNGMALYAAPQAPAVQADLRDAERWKQIATVAHCGGLAGLSESDALVLIRRLTLPVWDKSKTHKEYFAVIDAARAAQKGGES